MKFRTTRRVLAPRRYPRLRNERFLARNKTGGAEPAQRRRHRGVDRYHSDRVGADLLRRTAAYHRAVTYRAGRASVCLAAGADGDRHADFDRAWPVGADLFV